jgi:hypothetical protein
MAQPYYAPLPTKPRKVRTILFVGIAVVAVAAIVLVVLTVGGVFNKSGGGTSSPPKATLGSVTFTVAGTYTEITAADASVTSFPSGACFVLVPLSGSVALQVNAYDTHSNLLNGVIVNVAGGSGVLGLNVTPNSQETTGSSPFPAGEVQFSALTFTMPENTDTGFIELEISYSGGVADNLQDLDISVTMTNC